MFLQERLFCQIEAGHAVGEAMSVGITQRLTHNLLKAPPRLIAEGKLKGAKVYTQIYLAF